MRDILLLPTTDCVQSGSLLTSLELELTLSLQHSFFAAIHLLYSGPKSAEWELSVSRPPFFVQLIEQQHGWTAREQEGCEQLQDLQQKSRNPSMLLDVYMSFG